MGARRNKEDRWGRHGGSLGGELTTVAGASAGSVELLRAFLDHGAN